MPFLAYDIEKRKVGCVLLQAALGGDPEIAKRIPNEDWVIDRTEGLRVYQLSDADVENLVAMHKGLPKLVR